MVPAWLQVLAAVGDAFGGIATVVALLFAVRTYSNWSAQRRGEKRGDIAEETLLVIRAACLHLHHWCLLLAMEATQERGDEAATLDGIRSAVEFGRDGAGALRGNIHSLRWRTSVHLTAEEQRLLMDIEGLLVEAELDADGWARNAKATGRGEIRETFITLSRRADDLRARADAMLGPVARFEERGHARRQD